jgi:N-acetylmuramoyl-L-alanine amidase
MRRKVSYFVGALICLALAILILTIYLFDGGPPSEEKDGTEVKKARITANENDIDLLARAVYAEAKGEPYEGQVAVAAVILNRVEHPEFPNTIAGVIYEPLAFQVVANGQINRPADEKARQAALDAIYGLDTSKGALYFYNPNKTSNQWIRQRPVITKIGKHVFAA